MPTSAAFTQNKMIFYLYDFGLFAREILASIFIAQIMRSESLAPSNSLDISLQSEVVNINLSDVLLHA
jgi:hypothetical protein